MYIFRFVSSRRQTLLLLILCVFKFLKVSICDINAEEGEKLASGLASRHGKDRVIFCQCDVTDYPQFEGIQLISNDIIISLLILKILLLESFRTTISTFGHLDIVINNAGIMNDRFWELEVDINLVSIYFICHKKKINK